MGITVEEAKAIVAASAEAKKIEKAETLEAYRKADEARGWYLFLKDHSGTLAATQRKPLYYRCEANDQLMEAHCRAIGGVTLDNLEKAFSELSFKGVLARSNPEPYERKTDLTVSRVAPQPLLPVLPEPKKFLNMTRKQICDLRPSEIRKLTRQGFGPEIDRILVGKN